MCDEALEAFEIPVKIPEKIPVKIPEKIPVIPDEPIAVDIPTATPVDQVHIHYNMSDLMKQINIFIAYCLILFAMYIKSMHVSDELVCLPAPRGAPAPPSVMYVRLVKKDYPDTR